MTDEEYLAALKRLRPRQRATPSSEETKRVMAKELPELVSDYLLPHDAVDVGLMLLPGGKAARKAGAALIAGGASSEAEAGGVSKLATTGLSKLRELLMREAPEQVESVREALRRSARTGKEHAVVGAADQPVGGSVTGGERFQVVPSSMDRRSALMSDRPVLDMHTHPSGTFAVRPSPEDFAYYRDNYGAQVRSGPTVRELRTLIAQSPELGERARAGYNFFATDKPLAVFDPRRIDDARYEMQRGATRGKFRSIQDDPAFREYFEYGGDIGDLMDDAASLMLLRHRAEQGLGRQELMLGGRRLTPNPAATEQRLFEMMTPEALELLRARKLAEGGAVDAEEGDDQRGVDRMVQMEQGGSVQFNPDEIAQLASQFTSQFTPGYAAGGAVKYDPSEIEQLVAQMREEFHA